MHESLVNKVKDFVTANPGGACDVFLVGDSITIQWEEGLNGAGNSWDFNFPNYNKKVNIGIGGDKSYNVLWRLDHGGGDGLNPRSILLMIGNNNMFFIGETGAPAAAKGVQTCVSRLRHQFPTAPIIVAKILPFHDPGHPHYDGAKLTNTEVDKLKLGDLPNVQVLDMWSAFVNSDGTRKTALYQPDNIHLTRAGYNVYASYLKPLLDNILSGTPAPMIASLAPTSGTAAGGTTVTITGTNLTGTSSVTFGGTAATSVTVVSATSVTCVAPAHAAGAVNIVLTAPGGAVTSTGGYTYTAVAAAPTITSLAPTSGTAAGGTTVTITGTNLTGTSSVTFDGTAATSVTVVSATSVTCVTPAHAAGAVNVVLTAPGGAVTSTGGYTYTSIVAAPTITSLAPTSGTSAGGTTVTITGTNLTGTSSVTFDGTAATSVTVVSATSVTCVAPAHAAGAVNIVLTAPGGAVTSTGGYTFVIDAVGSASGSTASAENSSSGCGIGGVGMMALSMALAFGLRLFRRRD
jgi:lysophospholipase L1-like esterase